MTNIEDLIATANRYDRQELIQGWNQDILKNSKIIIIGSDILANYVALNASCLGFGEVEIYGTGKIKDSIQNFKRTVSKENSDYSEGFLYYNFPENESKVKGIENITSMMNQEISIKGINLDMSYGFNWSVIKRPTVIIDATNNPISKYKALSYAKTNNIPFVSVSSNSKIGKIGLKVPQDEKDENYENNLLFHDLENKQGEMTSMIMSALAVDEARKSLMLLPGEQKLDDIVVYNKQSNQKFDLAEDLEIKDEKVLRNKHILQIGAGSEGNFTALGFVIRDVGKLTLIDDDVAELINLNRQPFLYDGVDQPKVQAAIDKFKRINPRIEYEPIQKRVGLDFESYFENNKPDLIVDTVDNNKTRALLNYFSLKYDIPFISGGTRYNSGQAVVSVPGKTACLNCKVDIDKMALDSYTPQSCILAAQPSVITSNQIIAGLMVEEAERIVAPEIYGNPTNKIIKYISGESLRLGLLPTIERCDCNKNGYVNTWVDKMKHLYGG